MCVPRTTRKLSKPIYEKKTIFFVLERIRCRSNNKIKKNKINKTVYNLIFLQKKIELFKAVKIKRHYAFQELCSSVKSEEKKIHFYVEHKFHDEKK